MLPPVTKLQGVVRVVCDVNRALSYSPLLPPVTMDLWGVMRVACGVSYNALFRSNFRSPYIHNKTHILYKNK